MKKYCLTIFMVSVLGAFLVGCGFSSKQNIPRETESSLRGPTDATTATSSPSIDNDQTRILPFNETSTWVVYWDEKSADSELSKIQSLSALSVFGVYYNAKGEFIIPDLVKGKYHQGKKRYLSFVNDVINEDKTSSLKDLSLVESLLGSEAAQTKHIKELIDLTKKYGYDGIEIDYERLDKNKDLWPIFTVFINQLYQKASENNLDLRVVLEPSIDFSGIGFPEGPEYVIMCYNLFGDYSMEEGPKADMEFLDRVMTDSSSLKRRTMAFATGGFDWYGTEVGEVTEIEAIAAAKKYNQTPLRDLGSQALSFSYQDEKGISHKVWFADGVTLTQWKIRVEAKGKCGFALWRIGGNQLSTLKQVFS